MAACLFLRFWDPQGEATSNCERLKLNPTISPDGKWVVSGHNTLCDSFGGNSSVYLYVHAAGLNESRNNLVFRYSEHDGSGPPNIRWIGATSIEISIVEVGQITKSLDDMNGIKIIYKIGMKDFPTEK